MNKKERELLEARLKKLESQKGTCLIVGIIGILTFWSGIGAVCFIIALVLGSQARKEIDEIRLKLAR